MKALQTHNILMAFAASGLLLGGITSCSEAELAEGAGYAPASAINATVADLEESTPRTRTCIDESTAGADNVRILWTSGDQLGVFASAESTDQVCYTKNGTGASATASFIASSPLESPQYAYYPYSNKNNGRAATNLAGSVGTQNMANPALQYDYKVGALTASSEYGHNFGFTHLLSVGRFVVDASGTAIENGLLRTLTVTATRPGGAKVSLSGDFTFDAVNATYTLGESTQNTVGMNWTAGSLPSLSSPVTAYATMFPELKQGDTLKVEVTAIDWTAEIKAICQVDMQPGYIYDFPLTLNRYESLLIHNPEVATNDTIQLGPNKSTGTFTCACLNVDGLPTIINSEGPGEEGTTKIGNAINGLGWDFIAVSEDFSYHTQLYTALSNYNHGLFRNFEVGNILTGGRIDSDGLNIFWLNDGTVSVANETCAQFTEEYGGINEGANTLIAKGFRHCEVTLDGQVTVDVYFTHMNTYQDNQASMDAQHAQLRQIRDAVLTNMAKNKRPALIMGDSNMRYTRHQIQANLIDPVTQAGYVISDPWIELQRNNTYPARDNVSLMIPSKFGGGEILCYDDNKGEVVDKMWYINAPEATVQLKAKSYKNETENFAASETTNSFTGITYEDENLQLHYNYAISDVRQVTGIADHFPVVVEFEYTNYNPATE